MSRRTAHWLLLILILFTLFSPSLLAAHAQGPTPTPTPATPTATPVVPLPPGKDVRPFYDFVLELWSWLVTRLGLAGAILALPFGGSWLDIRSFVRCACRSRGLPDLFDSLVGFRVVLAPLLPIS